MPADANLVRSLREQQGLRREDLASRSRLSLPTIYRIERGDPVRLESLEAIARALDVDLTTLITDKVAARG